MTARIELPIARRSIPQSIREAAAQWPNKIWLDFSGDKMTFAEADEASTRLAHGLAALGVKFGDRVCWILDNHLDCAMTWIAVAKLGAINVPINTSFRGEFLRHQVADAGAAIMIADAEYCDRVVAVAAGAPELTTLVVRGTLPGALSGLTVLALDAIYSEDLTPIDAGVQPSDIAALLYTSGTTGPSKGCMIPHNYILNMGRQVVQHYGLRRDDVFWTPCPLFHMAAAGSTMGSLIAGVTMSIASRFSVSGFWEEIERSGATVITLLSSMIVYIADMPDNAAMARCFGQIRTVSGVPFSRAHRDAFERRFGVKYTGAPGYGMTEACSITMGYLEQPSPDGSSGRRLPDDFAVEVVDQSDNILPAGEVGEVVVRPLRPDLMFKGYWRRPEATVEALRNVWFHTGDLGRFDADGFFYFVDRNKDYLRKGGENISSFEVETVFRRHADLEDLAVHAVRAASEDEVKLTAILRADAEITEEELCRWSIDQLPHFAVPRFIEFRAELPRNSVGRVLKFQLRDDGVTNATWDRNESTIQVGKRTRSET